MAVASTGKGQRNLAGIENYSKFWQKDSKDDSQTDTANRLSEYTSVVNGESSDSSATTLNASFADRIHA